MASLLSSSLGAYFLNSPRGRIHIYYTALTLIVLVAPPCRTRSVYWYWAIVVLLGNAFNLLTMMPFFLSQLAGALLCSEFAPSQAASSRHPFHEYLKSSSSYAHQPSISLCFFSIAAALLFGLVRTLQWGAYFHFLGVFGFLKLRIAPRTTILDSSFRLPSATLLHGLHVCLMPSQRIVITTWRRPRDVRWATMGLLLQY